MTEVIGFKAADADLKCRDHQFEVGQTYTIDGEPVHCERGFHFCQNPLDVLNYYPLVQDDGQLTRFMAVVASGTVLTDGDKSVSAAIHVKAELRLFEFIKSAADTVIKLCKGAANKDAAASGNYSQLAASGYGSQLAASGYGSQLAASGDGSQLAASGNGSKLAASGYGSQLAASGDGSKLAASGNGSKLAIEGINGVAISAGGNSTVMGIDGTWVSLASYDNKGACTGIATGCIGKGRLKAGKVYRAENGKFVEVKP